MNLKKYLPILLAGTFLLLGGLLLAIGKSSRYSEVSFQSSDSSNSLSGWIALDHREQATFFNFHDLNGTEHSLKEFRRNAPLLIVFWKTDCPSCLLELPKLEQLEIYWKERGVKFLALGEDVSLKVLKRYADAHSPSYPVGWDRDGEAAFSYGVRGVPFVVVLDDQGRKAYEAFELPVSLENVFEGASES